MSVTRCVCKRKPFKDLLPLSRQHGWATPGEVAYHTGAGTGCGSCMVYIAAMLETGHTHFRIAEKGQAPEPCQPEPWDQE